MNKIEIVFFCSQESSRYNREDESESFFDRLMQEDQRHGKSWFDENNREQSDEEHSSPLRSKIVIKSSISRRDSRNNRMGDERENYRRYDNSRRRDSPSNKRSRTFQRDSSSGHDNSYKKSSHRSENIKETNKTANDKKNEKPKPLSNKSKKRLNLLENDLFRYTKQDVEREEPETSKKKRDKPVSDDDDKNKNKNEEIMQANLINSVHNDNLMTSKECETKSNEKFVHEHSDNTQTESTLCISEKNKIEETVLETSNNEYHETQQSDSLPLQKLLELRKESGIISIAELSPDINETGNSSTPVTSEEAIKELESDEKNRLSSSNLKYSGNKKINIQEHAEKNEQKFKSIGKKGENDCKPTEIIPLPDEKKDYNKNTEEINIKKANEVQKDTSEEKEIQIQNEYTNAQVKIFIAL